MKLGTGKGRIHYEIGNWGRRSHSLWNWELGKKVAFIFISLF